MKCKPPSIPSWQITPEEVYVNRRRFMRSAALVAGAALLAACASPAENTSGGEKPVTEQPAEAPLAEGKSDEKGNPASAYASITGYTNFYEFTTDKNGVASLAKDFRIQPWTIDVGGLVIWNRRYPANI